MRRPQGYAQVIGVGVVEHDSITCGHCSRIVLVKPGTAATVYVLPQMQGPAKEEPGAMCRVCMRHVCLKCHAHGHCAPLEKQIEQMEARGRFFQSVGL